MDLNQIVIDKDEAAERAAEYGGAEDQTAEDREIAAGYRAAAKGRPLIRLSQVIASGGFFDNGLPRLAVIRADGALQCFAWWNGWNGDSVIFADQTGSWVNRGALVGRHSVRVPVPADARPKNAGRRSGGTLVPVVPPPAPVPLAADEVVSHPVGGRVVGHGPAGRPGADPPHRRGPVGGPGAVEPDRAGTRGPRPAGLLMDIDEACTELATPTGDPDRDAVRLSFAENIRKGHMVPSGRDSNGQITVKLTRAGREFVEQMGKRR
jgi:hypothetical protein